MVSKLHGETGRCRLALPCSKPKKHDGAEIAAVRTYNRYRNLTTMECYLELVRTVIPIGSEGNQLGEERPFPFLTTYCTRIWHMIDERARIELDFSLDQLTCIF